MSPFTLRSALILAAAGTVLLTSCSSTSNSCTAGTDPSRPTLPYPSKKEHTVNISPAKARPGARPIEYFIAEISVPEQGGEDNFITRHLRASQKSGTPHSRFFHSLRELSQTKGVDLMNVGKAREGQTLHTNFARSFRYADEFTSAGAPKSYTTARTGVESSFHAELEDEGHTINLRCSVDIKEFTGFSKQHLPSGPEVLQPTFSKYSANIDIARIPNGGFALLDGPVRSDAQRIEDRRLGGLLRTKSDRIIHRYLAIGATTEPLSSPTAKTASAPVVASAAR